MEKLLERLTFRARDFGPTLAQLAYQRGLAVTDKEGNTKPIPISATPVIVEQAEIQRRAGIAARLSSAGFKMARAMLASEHRDLLVDAMSPIEKRILERTEGQLQRLATTRVDFFVTDRPFALELNTTIPAMQGYSDIAANTFIEVVGREAGMPDQVIAKTMAKNGSNALALYRALLDGYAQERSGMPERIALLCRRNDSQITELRYLRDRFTEWGTEAEIVHPDELSGADAVEAHGKKFDLVYRHLFVRRLEELDCPYLVDFFGQVPGKKAVFLNPPNAQIEVKTTFAFLSQAVMERGYARLAKLSDEELAVIKETVPWTRPFRAGPATDPDGKRVEDLVARVAGEPERFVLKRAWDYGGKAVFLGRAMLEPSFLQRTLAAYGAELSWQELCARAAEDRVGGGFVVQEVVPTVPEKHLLCIDGGVIDVDLYVDFSAYGSVNLAKQPAWGGVCRGSPSQIVNILGGGGVLPLITTEVAKSLHDAMLAWGRF
ncbi:MAG: hypothetical protein M3Y59_08320 [Myxococcota bacterium]|nr:hypothetical protein [Myxococcota bacterium]